MRKYDPKFDKPTLHLPKHITNIYAIYDEVLDAIYDFGKTNITYNQKMISIDMVQEFSRCDSYDEMYSVLEAHCAIIKEK